MKCFWAWLVKARWSRVPTCAAALFQSRPWSSSASWKRRSSSSVQGRAFVRAVPASFVHPTPDVKGGSQRGGRGEGGRREGKGKGESCEIGKKHSKEVHRSGDGVQKGWSREGPSACAAPRRCTPGLRRFHPPSWASAASWAWVPLAQGLKAEATGDGEVMISSVEGW